MIIKINGQNRNFEREEISISQVLKELDINKSVVIEINGEIVSKEEFDKIKLREKDALEILYFMGGG